MTGHRRRAVSRAYAAAGRETCLLPRCRGLAASLMALNEFANADGVAFAVPMARDGVGATGGINADLRPDDACGNADRGHLRNRYALLVCAEKARLHATDMQRRDHDANREKQIAARPAAGGKGLTGR